MLFELITQKPIAERSLYDRSYIVAIQTVGNTYFISAKEAEMSRDAKQLEEFIKDTLKDLKIAYISLKLVNAKRMVELQPQDA